MSERTPNLSMPLSPLTMGILVALGAGDHHGYSLLAEIQRQSEGRIKVGAGSLYAALQRLVDEGLIGESPDLPNPEEDQRRRYYRLTENGRAAVRSESHRMLSVLKEARGQRLISDADMTLGGAE